MALPHLHRRTLLMGAVVTLAGWAPRAPASEPPLLLEGQAFQRRVVVSGRELILNGAGLRAVAWIKGYAAALYLAAPARSDAQVLAAPGPKRLQLRLLRDVPASEFVRALRHGVERNTPAEELPRLADRLAVFASRIQGIGTVRTGDVVDLDLDPARGLLFALNGTLQGEAIAGEDLYAALLRGFVGERPYDKRLKAGLLGVPT